MRRLRVQVQGRCGKISDCAMMRIVALFVAAMAFVVAPADWLIFRLNRRTSECR